MQRAFGHLETAYCIVKPNEDRGMKMSKNKLFIIIAAVTTLLLYSNANGQENWQLYDDFNAASFDTNKWVIDDSSATISLEGGKAKFVHKEGFALDSSWLSIIDKPENVTGLKATITVASCSGDVRTRMAGFYGTIGSDLVWMSQSIRPYQETIKAGVSVNGTGPDYEWKYDLFYGNFQKPMTIIGVPFTLAAEFSPLYSVYSVNGVDELKYTYPAKLGAKDQSEIFTGIGTRSNSGTGTCTVYVDDVYILRERPVVLAPINALLLK